MEWEKRTEYTRVDESPEPVVGGPKPWHGLVRAREDGFERAAEDEGEDLEEETGHIHGLGSEVLLVAGNGAGSTSDHASNGVRA